MGSFPAGGERSIETGCLWVFRHGFDALSSGTPVIDKRAAVQRARRGEPEKAGKAKAEKGKAKSEEDKQREAALKRRCQQVAQRAGGANG